MTKEQLKKIMDAMQGITYHDWEALSFCINEAYQEAARQQSKAITLPDTRDIIAEYNRCTKLLG